MSFNPLEQKGVPLDAQFRDWRELNVEPVDIEGGDPYTRCRIVVMNGIEVESIMFSHQFARHTDNPEVKRALALSRRAEQMQQKTDNWLLPGLGRAVGDDDRLRAGGRPPDAVAGPDGTGPVPQTELPL